MKNFKNIKHFKPSEFSEPEKISHELLCRLDALREYLGLSIMITSSTEGEHVESSQHYLGKAVDVVIPNYQGSLFSLYLIIERFGFRGIGLYPDWKLRGKKIGGFHLDVRTVDNYQSAKWIGYKNKLGVTKYSAFSIANLIRMNIITCKKS